MSAWEDSTLSQSPSFPLTHSSNFPSVSPPPHSHPSLLLLHILFLLLLFPFPLLFPGSEFPFLNALRISLRCLLSFINHIFLRPAEWGCRGFSTVKKRKKKSVCGGGGGVVGGTQSPPTLPYLHFPWGENVFTWRILCNWRKMRLESLLKKKKKKMEGGGGDHPIWLSRT